MKQPISGYHRDAENHWVAQLACRHFQHVRHCPPLSFREWTQTKAGRDSMIGFKLDCVKCDEGAPPDEEAPPGQRSEIEKEISPIFQPNRTNTILYCRRWSETVDFYCNVLGLRSNFENDWFVEFQLNENSFLSVADASRASINDVRGQGITLSWQTDDVEQSLEQLTALGVEATTIQTKWNAWLFYFHDPEGHRIELWQPVEVKNPETGHDLASSVPDWLIDHPELLRLFKELNIDYCCGGKSLETACHQQGHDPEMILQRMLQLIQADRA